LIPRPEADDRFRQLGAVTDGSSLALRGVFRKVRPGAYRNQAATVVQHTGRQEAGIPDLVPLPSCVKEASQQRRQGAVLRTDVHFAIANGLLGQAW
jgi:hypothetical protein